MKFSFVLVACITFISQVSGKTFLIQTLRKVSPQFEAGEEYSEDDGEEYSEDDKNNEGDLPSGYKETMDSMESKG